MQIRIAQALTVVCQGVVFHEVGIFREADITLHWGVPTCWQSCQVHVIEL